MKENTLVEFSHVATSLVTYLFTSVKNNNDSVETFLVNSGANSLEGITFAVVVVLEAPM